MAKRKRIYRLWAIQDPGGYMVRETIAQTTLMAWAFAAVTFGRARRKHMERSLGYRAVKLRVEVLDD